MSKAKFLGSGSLLVSNHNMTNNPAVIFTNTSDTPLQVDVTYAIKCKTISKFWAEVTVGFSQENTWDDAKASHLIHRTDENFTATGTKVIRIQSIIVPPKYGINLQTYFENAGTGFGLNDVTYSVFGVEV